MLSLYMTNFFFLVSPYRLEHFKTQRYMSFLEPTYS